MAWYNSSANADKISLTLKGIIPLLVLGATYFKWDIQAADFSNLVDGIVAVVVQGGILISAVMTVYGAVRKMMNKTKTPPL